MRCDLVDLPRPRSLREDERALLTALATALGGEALLRQTQRVQVVSVCACGCASIGLLTPEPPASADELGPPTTPGAHAISGWAPADGHEVDVTLHVIEGLLHELEIWPGWDGSAPTDVVPDADQLRLA